MSRPWVHTLVTCLVLVSYGLPSHLGAQNTEASENGEPIVLGQRFHLPSSVLDEERPLLVFTPPGYEQSPEGLPVLYLLDGDGHFHHASGVAQFLASNLRMPAMIVVGIPNVSQDGRTRDLTPPLTVPDTADRFPTAGGGSDFLRFLTEEVQPWVEGRYRTQPFRVLVGHSFGGLFITQVLMEDPDAFEAYVSISPSLWWDEGKFVAQAASIFEDHPDLSGWLHLTMGNEGGEMLAGAWSLASILETKAPDSFRWRWSHMPEEDHGSVPHRSLYDGLEWIFQGWNLPDAFELAMAEGGAGWSEINEHYSELSERFGFTVRAPEQMVNQVGYILLREERLDDAIRAFEMNADLYPSSANVFDSLGDAYEAACRWEEARESFATAYRMGSEGSNPNAETYKANLDRLTAKIESGQKCVVGGSLLGTD